MSYDQEPVADSGAAPTLAAAHALRTRAAEHRQRAALKQLNDDVRTELLVRAQRLTEAARALTANLPHDP